MSQLFMVLNYTNKTLMRDLAPVEVCVLLRYFMSQPSPSFEVVTHSNKFVTADFVEMEDGTWRHEPQPVAV